jgi:hypothetical protein
MEIVYCVYTGSELPASEMSSEHIIPLALGGVNAFQILVEKEFNSKVGSSIDGTMANDFLTQFRRRHFGSKGHSKKRPFPFARNSRLSETGKPVQVAFKEEGIQVYSPTDKRHLTQNEIQGQNLVSVVSVDLFSRLRFTAKVALASGYYIYGDLFRDNVDIDELRRLMMFDVRKAKPIDFEGMKTRGWFWPHEVESKDSNDFAMYRYFARLLDCSFVLTIPCTCNVIIVVALLGELVGILNVPAQTKDFPVPHDEHDLGHVVILRHGTAERMSYRALAQQAYQAMR